ncbi:hypothetical protein [Listeria grayi]|uniref:hypothetical protein n=1 Tax=Listeria grayi TaxID=1641 RepID=UPI001628A130|nr:hypothetical protein [Listeria grayi]MBC1921968.1 hypothetical protein [Listeria grayi]
MNKDDQFTLDFIDYIDQGFDLVMHRLVEQSHEAIAEATRTIIANLDYEEAIVYKARMVADTINKILD